MNDLLELSKMEYSGRTVMIGRTVNGDTFGAYALTGRSPSSKARRLVEEVVETNMGDITTIRTTPTDPEALKKGNPSLLIYDAMAAAKGNIVVSNGQQTKLILREFLHSVNNSQNFHGYDLLNQSMAYPVLEFDSKKSEYIDITSYEPDPISTSRVSGFIYSSEIMGNLHISRLVEGKNVQVAEKKTFTISFVKGEGRFISTYNGGNESGRVLPFEGGPRTFLIDETSAQGIAEKVFEAIEGGSKPGKNFRISAAAMVYTSDRDLDTCIINEF